MGMDSKKKGSISTISDAITDVGLMLMLRGKCRMKLKSALRLRGDAVGNLGKGLSYAWTHLTTKGKPSIGCEMQRHLRSRAVSFSISIPSMGVGVYVTCLYVIEG